MNADKKPKSELAADTRRYTQMKIPGQETYCDLSGGLICVYLRLSAVSLY
jgi:hypothetical protein